MSGRLNGKVAVITGTGGGQGRAAALRFAAEGASVVGGDLKVEGAAETAEMVRQAGGTMTSMAPLDFNDRDSVTAWLDAAVREYGGIDILYNNASAPRFASIADMLPEDWSFTLHNELDIVFTVTQLAWPHLVNRGGGSIINTASMQGIAALPMTPGGFAHAATKHGVIGMTRELAAEGGPVGIRVNSVSPGLIFTPVVAAIAEQVPGFVDGYIEKQIIKRVGQPEDVVSAALYLAADESSFVTGSNIIVDGGYSTL